MCVHFMNLVKIIKSRRFIVGIIALLAISFFVARTFILPKKTTLESTTVKKGDLKQELTLSGKIEAEERVTLQFQTAGQLAWVGVKEGDYVQKYQGLASLDQRQLKKTLEKKLNDYMTTRWDFEQTKDNAQSGVLLGQQRYNLEAGNKAAFSGQHEINLINDMIKRILEKSQFQLNNSVLEVELQTLSIDLANLWTPINGIVTRIDAPFPGLNITPAQAQFEIVNPGSVFLEVTADQTEVVNLKEGMEATIIFDSYPNKPLKGVIKNISFIPKKEETGTVYRVKVAPLEIDNKNYQYRIGMTADATFTIAKSENVLYLPLRFVKSDEKGKYVFLGEKRKKAYVRSGFETDNDLEIVSGLSQGNLVYD